MTLLAKVEDYGTISDGSTFTIQRWLPGPVDRIWTCLTDSDHRRKWLAAGDMQLAAGASLELVWRNEALSDPSDPRAMRQVQLQGIMAKKIGFQPHDRGLGRGPATAHFPQTHHAAIADHFDNRAAETPPMGTVGMTQWGRLRPGHCGGAQIGERHVVAQNRWAGRPLKPASKAKRSPSCGFVARCSGVIGTNAPFVQEVARAVRFELCQWLRFPTPVPKAHIPLHPPNGPAIRRQPD